MEIVLVIKISLFFRCPGVCCFREYIWHYLLSTTK